MSNIIVATNNPIGPMAKKENGMATKMKRNPKLCIIIIIAAIINI